MSSFSASPKTPQSQESITSRRSGIYSPQDRHKKLRQALDRTSLLQENTTVGVLDVLKEAFTEVDDIHEDIEDRTVNQDQILLDSQVMKISSHVIKGCMHSLSQEANPYSGFEFAEKLLNYMSYLPDETVPELNWELLGRDVVTLIKACGSYSSILHCLEPIPKTEVQNKKTKTPRKARDALMPAKKPEKVLVIDNDDNPVDQSVGKIIQLIKKYYKRNQEPLNFFKLVINPDDFGKTVENMLHVAFLLRDGKMSLVLGPEGHLFIEPVPQHIQDEQQNRNDVNRIPNVPSLTIQKWKILIEQLEITEPMINFQ